MLDENLIATLEQSLRQTRNAQNRLMGQLREKESEVENLRVEIGALENSAAQTEKAIDSLLVATRAGKRPTNFRIVEDDAETETPVMRRADRQELPSRDYGRDNSVAYIHQNRPGGPPPIHTGYEPLSNRFNDRT